MTYLEVVKLACAYGKHEALSNVSFSICCGERVALLGPNGSGKSTLIKAATASIPIQSGELSLFGKSIGTLNPLEIAKLVSVVPQEEQTHFPFSVRDIVSMGRLPHSKGLKDTPEDIHATTEAMERADCLQLENRRIDELSGGERQRVLIARALAQGGKLMLLDEPTAHLDINHQLEIAKMLAKLEPDRAILVALHDLNLAARFASRAILLCRGRIVLDAPIAEVLASQLLDETYDVTFRRIPLEDGRLALVPA